MSPFLILFRFFGVTSCPVSLDAVLWRSAASLVLQAQQFQKKTA
jgi:hypothetical protein